MRTFREWCDGRTPSKRFHLAEDGDYDETNQILRFWYIVDKDVPGISKFVLGLSNLMADCFPEERKYTETLESDNSSLVHRYICVCHEDD